MANVQKGRSGEMAAEMYLLNKGMQLIARNVRYPGGEIDLVMLEEDTIVFVEVKMRTGAFDGLAAITPRKQANISKAALRYLYETDKLDAAVRFDALEVLRRENEMEFTHIQAAFDFIPGRFFV